MLKLFSTNGTHRHKNSSRCRRVILVGSSPHEFTRTSIHSSVVNSRRFPMNSSTLMTLTWNGVKLLTLNGRIFLLWISVSSYVRSIVPHIPPERSMGY